MIFYLGCIAFECFSQVAPTIFVFQLQFDVIKVFLYFYNIDLEFSPIFLELLQFLLALCDRLKYWKPLHEIAVYQIEIVQIWVCLGIKPLLKAGDILIEDFPVTFQFLLFERFRATVYKLASISI